MNDQKKCPYCAEEIKAEAVFCKHCQTDLSKPLEPTLNTGEKIKHAPFTGALAGAGCGIWLIIIGILLTCTVVGAIIGVPMILIGLLAPFLGLGAIKGNCPYCGNHISTAGWERGVTCSTCKKRILIKNNEFVRID